MSESVYDYIARREREDAALGRAAPAIHVAISRALPILRWASCHGSRCDEEIAACEVALLALAPYAKTLHPPCTSITQE